MPNQDSFRPNGAQELQMHQAAGPQLGRQFAVGGQPAQAAGRPQRQAPVQVPAQIGQMNAPKGAQPVALAGMAASQRQAPQRQAFMGRSAPQAPPSQERMQTHLVVVEGQAPDGGIAVAKYHVEFPEGTKILGVTEQIVG